jgi:DMSO/TMAO reductase YedYZ heme-binding membrane subunit
VLSGTLPWYVARASGLIAWALLSASVTLGLLLATRILGPSPKPAVLLRLHRRLATLSLWFVGLHLTGILLDSYVHFSLADLFVPLASAWHPVAVAWGVVAFYLLAAVAITSLAFRWLPRRVRRLWRPVHLATHALFALSTIHLLSAGTDAGNVLLRPVVAAVVAGIGVLAVMGAAGRRLPPATRTGRSSAATLSGSRG